MGDVRDGAETESRRGVDGRRTSQHRDGCQFEADRGTRDSLDGAGPERAHAQHVLLRLARIGARDVIVRGDKDLARDLVRRDFLLQARAERIRDLATVQGVRPNQLIGYGLVVGLDGSGDQTTQTPFTVQSLTSMLSQLGINLPPGTTLQLKNVAAVMVTRRVSRSRCRLKCRSILRLHHSSLLPRPQMLRPGGVADLRGIRSTLPSVALGPDGTHEVKSEVSAS